MTQGFSPRAKISFAPELPAGVVALNEPVDMYFQDAPADIIARMNDALPEGFTISRAIFPPEDSPNLGKLCKAAEYLLRTTNGENLSDMAVSFWADSVILAENIDGWLRIIVSYPAQNPVGGLVRNLIGNNIISGWHQVNAVRVAIGHYDSGRVKL